MGITDVHVENLKEKITCTDLISVQIHPDSHQWIITVNEEEDLDVLNLMRKIGLIPAWEFMYTLGCKVDSHSLKIISQIKGNE